ncbi:hypothetical protein YC2023_018036 [Brassica napus]
MRTADGDMAKAAHRQRREVKTALIAPLSGIIQTQVICFFKHNINQIISTINICSTYVDFAAATSSNYLFAHGLPPLSPSFRRHQRPLEPARAFNPFLVVEDTGLWPLSDIPPNI